MTHQEREAVPRRHVPATGQEDRADAMLPEQPVLDRVVADALVAADRDPPSFPDNRQPHGVRRLRPDVGATTVGRVHDIFAHDRECLADTEKVGVNEEPDVWEWLAPARQAWELGGFGQLVSQGSQHVIRAQVVALGQAIERFPRTNELDDRLRSYSADGRCTERQIRIDNHRLTTSERPVSPREHILEFDLVDEVLYRLGQHQLTAAQDYKLGSVVDLVLELLDELPIEYPGSLICQRITSVSLAKPVHYGPDPLQRNAQGPVLA